MGVLNQRRMNEWRWIEKHVEYGQQDRLEEADGILPEWRIRSSLKEGAFNEAGTGCNLLRLEGRTLDGNWRKERCPAQAKHLFRCHQSLVKYHLTIFVLDMKCLKRVLPPLIWNIFYIWSVSDEREIFSCHLRWGWNYKSVIRSNQLLIEYHLTAAEL